MGNETLELDLDYIQKKYEKNKFSNEENIKNKVVRHFLEMLDYDEDSFDYEHKTLHRKGRADIVITVGNNDNNCLYIETKKANEPLDAEAKDQLATYIFNRGKEWGILTNGRKYLLFNSNIKGHNNLERIVFEVDIFNKKDKRFIKYFSKKNIFEREITKYFRDIADFKIKKFTGKGSSWEPYKGTLYSFFMYYSNIHPKYRSYDEFREDDVEDFILNEMDKKVNENVAKKITSIQTLYNKYSHIRSFLKSQGSTKFYIERDQLIEKINLKEKDITEQNILSDETIKTILGFYSKRRESIRNTAIFLVCLCYGFERSTLSKLSFDNVKNKKLFIEDRVLDIPPKLFNVLSELKSVNKKNKVKGNYFFYSSINNSKVLANQSFNEIFKLLGKIDDNDPKWNSITPTAIRASLIRRMFNNNYSIEEISYITGADLINLANIISYEDILSKVKSKKKISVNKHPFNFVLY